MYECKGADINLIISAFFYELMAVNVYIVQKNSM